MTGIFGALATDGDVLPAMAERLRHRGDRERLLQPDRQVRLGCIYPSHASATTSKDGCVVVGDLGLLNRDRLRERLQNSCSGALETEIDLVLALYGQRGEQAFAALEGVFACALWDAARGELVLARDLFGCQPLYLARPRAGGLLFASEYKALLADPEVAAQPDLAMVQLLQSTKHLPPTRTLIEGIEAIPPGAVVVFDARGQVLRQHRLEMPPLEVASAMTFSEATTLVQERLLQAVESRVEGRGRIGVALSGGIDSMGLACACRRGRPDLEIHTFTAGADAEDPEIRRARYIAERIGARHHDVFVEPDRLASLMPPLVWHLETPIARSETAQFLEVGRVAAAHVDCLLTGAAADGLFAGMPRHKVLWLMSQLPQARTALGEFFALTQSGRPPQSLGGRLLDRLYFRGRVPPVPHIRGAEDSQALPDFGTCDREFVNSFTHRGFQDALAGWLPKIERTFAASGVRHSSPFVDPQLVAVAFTIPTAYKIRRGRGKLVLRRALQSILPDELINVPKFPMRMSHEGAFRDALHDLAAKVLTKDRVQVRGFFDTADVRRMIEASAKAPFEGVMRLWTAILTEIWAEIFLDHRGRRPSGG